MTDYTQNIMRGIAFLDEKYLPFQWRDYVDWAKIDESHASNCILGQLFHHSIIGIRMLGLTEDDVELFGFDVPYRKEPVVMDQEYAELTRQWRFLGRTPEQADLSIILQLINEVKHWPDDDWYGTRASAPSRATRAGAAEWLTDFYHRLAQTGLPWQPPNVKATAAGEVVLEWSHGKYLTQIINDRCALSTEEAVQIYYRLVSDKLQERE